MARAAKAVFVVLIITFTSKILVLLVNAKGASLFGVNMEMSIFAYATQLPNLVFVCIGTALSNVVMPIFAGYLGKGEKDKAFKFANNMISITFIASILLTIICVLLSPILLYFTGFKDEWFGYARAALNIMFPIMIFYSMSYIFQGMLQSMERYYITASVSLFSSMVIMGYLFIFGSKYGVMGYLIATFIGLSTQAIVLIPSLSLAGFKFKPLFILNDTDFLFVLKQLPIVLIGTSAYQINMIFNNNMSTNFENGPMLMNLVQSLILNAVLSFVLSVTAVYFPKFSMAASKGNMEEFKKMVVSVLGTVLFIMIPAAVLFILLRFEIMDIFYGWGKVTKDDIETTGTILAFYSFGTIGVSIKEVMDRAFYSLKDTAKPAYNGIIIMIINIVSTLILMKFIGLYSIPLSFTISMLSGGVLIILLMLKKVGGIGIRKLAVSLLKVIAASLVMFLFAGIVHNVVKYSLHGNGLLDKSLKLILPSLTAGFVYIPITYILRVPSSIEFINGTVSKIKNHINA